MDKNRKIMAAIMVFLTLSVALSVVKINITMNSKVSSAGASALDIASGEPGVGIVRVSGVISASGEGGMFPQSPGCEAVVSRLSDMMEDDRVKAVVLRIDSPGGTVGATQEIFQKLMQLRMKKPLVASMGDIAASGGFYISSAANFVMANQGSLTGSIGVIIAAPNTKGLFEKLGIKMNVIKSGKYKDILSSSRDLSDDEKQLLQELIDSSYNQFLKDVSLGRNIPIDDFKKYADGRVFNGEKALEYGLIDGIGTLEDSIKKAKALAKLPENAPVYDERFSPIDVILGRVENAFGAVSLSLPYSRGIIEYRYNP